MNRSRGRRTRKNGCELPAGPGVWPDGLGMIEFQMLPWYEKLNLIAGMMPVPEGVPGPSGPCRTGHEWVVYSKAVAGRLAHAPVRRVRRDGHGRRPRRARVVGGVPRPVEAVPLADATRVTERGFASPRT